MDNVIQANKFLDWINKHYDEQKNKLMAFCHDKHYEWDADTFQDCIVKIHNKIMKKALIDDSDKGFDSYFFITFKLNSIREKQYARNQKRDRNITDLFEMYESYKTNELTQHEKLKSDLYKDFATLYLLQAAEQQFDTEAFYLFKLKTFEKITYKQLQERTGIKGVRQKVISIKNWLRANISKEEVNRAFQEIYGDIISD